MWFVLLLSIACIRFFNEKINVAIFIFSALIVAIFNWENNESIDIQFYGTIFFINFPFFKSSFEEDERLIPTIYS